MSREIVQRMQARFVIPRELPYNGIARLDIARLDFVPECSFTSARFMGEAAG
jgi:hypothetical protein